MSFVDSPASFLHYNQELIRAVMSGDVSKVRKLLDLRLTLCEINLTDIDSDGLTYLHHACSKGHLEMARMLILEFGADTTIRTNSDNTALHVAALAGKEKVAIALIREFGCSTDVRGQAGRSLLRTQCMHGWQCQFSSNSDT